MKACYWHFLGGDFGQIKKKKKKKKRQIEMGGFRCFNFTFFSCRPSLKSGPTGITVIGVFSSGCPFLRA